jgi:hypothetical protein
MNIFVLDNDVAKCAEYHCDKHVVKMILESAQILSTVCRQSGLDVGYKPTHSHHPCTIWASESLDNWIWLRNLTALLNAEYKYRYEKSNNHKSYDLVATLPLPNIPDIGLTPFAQAMPDEYKHDDAVVAYRNYYKCVKAPFLQWTKRPIPKWVLKED